MLTSPTDGLGAIAYSINNNGWIVGSQDGASDGINKALLWYANSVFDLKSLVDTSGDNWDLVAAYDINNKGEIVGYGFNPQGLTRAFLLTPVHSPGVLHLILSCFIALVISRLVY